MQNLTKHTLLRLKRLKFVSLVDRPANPESFAIVKRDGGEHDIEGTARVFKVDEQLGIVLGFANVSTVNGEPLVDLQDDVTCEDELLKVCAEYAESGAAVDEMHDEQPVDGARTVFLFPLSSAIAKEIGLGDVAKTGILIGVKLPPETLAKFKSGELNAFSIGGTGEREQLDAAPTEKSAPKAKPADPYELAKALLQASVESYQQEHGIRTFEEAFAKATGDDPATRAAYEAASAIRNAGAPRYIAPNLPPNTAEVVKSARNAVAKAELDLRRAVLAVKNSRGLRTYDEAMMLATATDPTARKAFDELADARERLRKAPMRAATAKLDDEITQLRKSLAAQVEEFSLRHNLTPDEARDRLALISPSFAKMQDRVLAAGHARQMAAHNGSAR